MKASLFSLSFAAASMVSLASASTLEHVSVASPSLQGVPHASDSREAIILLPDHYNESDTTYPVLYVLHGFGGDSNAWFSSDPTQPNIQRTVDQLTREGLIDDMIIVVPNTKTLNLGSWYQPSDITGDWRSFMLQDLQDYVQTQYRANNQQALLGHSMGAYGALDLALHEDFASVAAMSTAGYMMKEFEPSFNQDSYMEIKPELAAKKNGDDDLSYLAHIYVSLLQLAAPDSDAAPFFFVESPTLEDFDHFNDLALLRKIAKQPKNIEDLAVRLEMGRGEDQIVQQEISEVQQLLTKLGADSHLHWFDGGHTDQMYKTLRDNILFIDQHWAQ